jgi:PBSX family phage terminase large subunit
VGTSVLFKPTKIQRKALALLKSGAKHILLFGGSRSGKTTVIVMAIIFRALMYAGSRHLICRLRAKDARSSVLRETLIPWLDNTIGKSGYTYLAHESVVKLYNGSEIWIGGLGDKEQVDKILGHEYCTIFFNEVSQLSYLVVTTAYSRLAMKVKGCRNLFYYDCNPGSFLHWTYKIFILKIFLSGEPLEKPELYASMILNPKDNLEHLPEDYISDILEALPEKQKNRFLYGLWGKQEGAIYEKFEESMIIKFSELPEKFDRYAAGQDFGLNITNVKIAWLGDVIYVLSDYGAFNMTTKSFNTELEARGWFECPDGMGLPVYCDPAGGERIQEVTGGVKANNSVESGIDYINAKIERGQFFVCEKCTGVLSEIWDYCRDEEGEIVKVNDHYLDALRYAVFSDVQQGVIFQ